ncbi:MAG: DsrE family protein [Gammaproteobacteria bacterium]|jgi:predicted peroxiredoxin|nr:DsrE family protein [Gammaproteobacteria bacterium]
MNKKTQSRKKLLIVMSNADPSRPEACYAPLFQATVAAALSYDVEVVLTGASVQLAVADNAGKVEINLDTHSTLYDVIQEAHRAGVCFKACNTSLNTAVQELIAEVEEKVGAAYVIGEAMEKNTVTLTY